MRIHRLRAHSPRRSRSLLLGALLLGLSLMLSLAGCGSLGSSDPLLAARVNGHSIPVGSYLTMVQVFKAATVRQGGPVDWQSPTGRTTLAQTQQTALDFLINLELIREQVKSQNITISPKDTAAAKKQFEDNIHAALQQDPNDAALQAYIKAFTPDVVAMLVEQQVDETALIQKVSVPTVHARVIFVNTKGDAQKLQQQAEQGADFGQLAKDNSLDSSTAPTGGDLGTAYPGKFTTSFDKAVFDSKLTGKYLILPLGGKYALFEITNPANQPLSKFSDPQEQQSAFGAWLTQIVRPKAQISQYVTFG